MANKGSGWHKESKRHADAAKGKGTKDSSQGSGWHGDSKGHSKAAKGETKSGGIMDKLTGNS